MKKSELSILIPTFNDICVELVSTLQQQAEALPIDYEIVVADDGSTDTGVVACNRAINQLHHCRYVERQQNTGRAAVRNFLAETARYQNLLFIDSDIDVPSSDFLRRYAEAAPADVVDGGLQVGGDAALLDGKNIRFLYERAAAPAHTVAQRQKQPYRSFRTTNFMITRRAMLACPFDERFRHYGYEDVLLGKQLRQQGFTISHIDNPVLLTDYESNAVFMAKTEEALRTLHQFRHELQDYSTLLTTVARLQRMFPTSLLRLWHTLFGQLERRNLCGPHPRLRLFNLYKTGYYLSLTHKNKTT